MLHSIAVSVIVPVYSGAEYLERLLDALSELRLSWRRQQAPFHLAEVIFADDAAIDGSGAIIDEMARRHDWVIALHLSRNFGQHPATIAGILHSSGDWVVTMDEDLQHRPEVISDLLRKATVDQSDIVYANPKSQVHEAALRDRGSRAFKRLMRWLTDNDHISSFNSFRLIRGPMARAAASVCSHDTYLDIALSWFTKRVGVLPVEMKDERYIKTGKSGYSVKSLLSHARRMVFSSQIKLLRIGALLGLIAMAFSLLAMLYFLFLKIFFPGAIEVEGWTSLFLAITFFGGLSAFMLGIILQYLSSIVLRAHGKPTFFTIDRSDDQIVTDWFERAQKAAA
ncbi:glycosyltransferase [Paracoccus aminophilus]|uniref:glycosyltransferase n=1 Tax=Paracoccus aminophilus TaxID=34003 RepID=UPI000425EBEC|nr:glycosyltransferase [Paracoccus aminophilus]